MVIIGVTGTFNAGKGTLSSYISEKYGFNHFSVRQFIIEHYTPKDLEFTDERDRLRRAADRMRAENGPNYMIKELYEKALESKQNSIIESVRCPSEAQFILDHKGILLGIDADIEKRYNRMQGTKDQASIYATIEDMREKEEKEMHNTDPTRGNIAKCLEMAKAFHVFYNNGTTQELHNEIGWVIPRFINPEGIIPDKERRG